MFGAAVSHLFQLVPRNTEANKVSLALLELRLILAKILWSFDMELQDDDLDWDQANKNYVFWEKPALPILFKRARDITQ